MHFMYLIRLLFQTYEFINFTLTFILPLKIKTRTACHDILILFEQYSFITKIENKNNGDDNYYYTCHTFYLKLKMHSSLRPD